MTDKPINRLMLETTVELMTALATIEKQRQTIALLETRLKLVDLQIAKANYYDSEDLLPSILRRKSL